MRIFGFQFFRFFSDRLAEAIDSEVSYFLVQGLCSEVYLNQEGYSLRIVIPSNFTG